MRKMKKKAETGDTTAGLVDQLNLEEFAGVLDNAPPGTDELVALSKVRRNETVRDAEGGCCSGCSLPKAHLCCGLWRVVSCDVGWWKTRRFIGMNMVDVVVGFGYPNLR